MSVLRRLTFRLTFGHLFNLTGRDPFGILLSTIVSPIFCELVLEFCGKGLPLYQRPLGSLELRTDFDSILEEKFARSRDFRLIIRAGKLDNWDFYRFRMQVHQGFPLLAGRGCIYLETL